MTALLFARNEVHADELIAGLILECAEGKSDREPEALGLAKLWRINEASVSERFAEAREALREQLQQPEEKSWYRKRGEVKARLNGEGPQIDAALKVSARPDDKAQLDASVTALEVPKGEPQAEPEEQAQNA